MKIKRSLALFLCSILLFTGCSHESRQEVSKTFFAMDTVMNFSVYGDEKILDQTETIISDPGVTNVRHRFEQPDCCTK